MLTVLKRDGTSVPFELSKIEKAIENTFSDIHRGYMISIDLFRIIEDHMLNFKDSIFNISTI